MFWKVAGSVLSRNSNELLVLDEAEDVFNDMGTLHKRSFLLANL